MRFLPKPKAGLDSSEVELLFKNYWAALSKTEYDDVHFVRFLETSKRLATFINAETRILEVGSKSRISEFFENELGVTVSVYESDLRFPWKIACQNYDLVLMLEVLEHINDRLEATAPVGEIATFCFNGAINSLSEAYRCLSRGGSLIITTPNATSLDSIGRLLIGRHPFQYEPHVREYAPRDVLKLAKLVGFKPVEWSTFFAWNALPGIDRARVDDLISRYGSDQANRGDDAFYAFKKV